MHISRHAATRQRQRAVSADAIDFAIAFGDIHRQGRGHLVYVVTDRALRDGCAPGSDRLRGLTVVEVDGVIVTVWKDSRVRHRRARIGVSPRATHGVSHVPNAPLPSRDGGAPRRSPGQQTDFSQWRAA